jgi:hypothetical protein
MMGARRKNERARELVLIIINAQKDGTNCFSTSPKIRSVSCMSEHLSQDKPSFEGTQRSLSTNAGVTQPECMFLIAGMSV